MASPVYHHPDATNRGVHFHPLGFHNQWAAEWPKWIDLLQRMHMSWVVVLSEGDAVLKPMPELQGRSVVGLFLEHGIHPVVRFSVHLDRPWPHMVHVEELVRQFDEYGLTPLVLMGNEPGDPREYVGDVPSDWPQRYIGYFMRHGTEVVRAGAVALFADGPSWPYDPFPSMEPVWSAWEDGWMGYAGHWYGLNRPPDWPYDSVTQTGQPLLTEQDLVDWFGPFHDDRGLNDVPVEIVNEARRTGAQPGLTAIEDDTCWRGWERVAHQMTTHFGRPLLLCETEGGWTPGAAAGTGSDRDLRFLKPTPDQVGEWTLASFQADTPLLFQCHWLLGDSVLGGAGGWDMDAWCTGWWRHGGPDYWFYMPAVQACIDHPPGLPQDAVVKVTEARDRIGRAADLLASIEW